MMVRIETSMDPIDPIPLHCKTSLAINWCKKLVKKGQNLLDSLVPDHKKVKSEGERGTSKRVIMDFGDYWW